MGALSKKLRSVSSPIETGGLAYWCQGCDSCHVIWTGPGKWGWDGNTEAPTFTPSVLVTYRGRDADMPDAPPSRCHTFITGGMVQFLPDCTHDLAGQTLPLPDWPYGDGEYGGVEPMPASA